MQLGQSGGAAIFRVAGQVCRGGESMVTPKPCPWSGSLPCLSCCSAGWGVKTAKGGAWGQPPESGFQHKLGSPEVPLKPKGGGPALSPLLPWEGMRWPGQPIWVGSGWASPHLMATSFFWTVAGAGEVGQKVVGGKGSRPARNLSGLWQGDAPTPVQPGPQCAILTPTGLPGRPVHPGASRSWP